VWAVVGRKEDKRVLELKGSTKVLSLSAPVFTINPILGWVCLSVTNSIKTEIGGIYILIRLLEFWCVTK